MFIDYAIGTHTGLVRELNEDSHLAEPELGLWAVADGMGGHEAGEVASAIAVQAIAESMRQGASLTKAIETAHHAIQAADDQDKQAGNMGSTVVVAKLDGNRYDIAWVGDSRAYLWNGTLRQLTTDHSYVQLLLKAGVITEDAITNHPSRNIISQGLGVGGLNSTDVTVDSVTGDLTAHDTLLLCSDGLSSEIDDNEMAAILAATTDNKKRVESLIEAALQHGGKDNITVVVLTLITGG